MMSNVRVKQWVRPLLGVITFIFCIWVLYTTLGGNLRAALAYITLPVIGIALLASGVHAIANAILVRQWGRMLHALGAPLPAQTVAWIWTRAQLTRFAIGSAGMVSRPVLAKRYGVRLRIGTSTTLLETVWLMAMLGMGLPFAAYVTDKMGPVMWLAGLGCLLLVIGLTLWPSVLLTPLTWLRSSLVVEGLQGEGIGISAGYFGQLLLRALAFVIVAGAINSSSLATWPTLVGAFVLSYLVGWLIIISPGGLGPREAVAGVMLSHAHLNPEEILALVAIARIVEVVGELAYVAYVGAQEHPALPAGEGSTALPVVGSTPEPSPDDGPDLQAGKSQGANSSDE